MRARILIAFAAVVAVGLAAAFLTAGGASRPGPHHPTSAAPAAHQPAALPPADIFPFDTKMTQLLPLHQAVRRAAGRFDGRVLEIALAPPRPAEAANGIEIVYRIRMLTGRRDVLDIRMDALTGAFLEVRGSDLGAARRKGKRKDDD